MAVKLSCMKKINPFLWFDSEAEEAAKFYVGIFKNSKIWKIARYGEEAAQKTGRPAGSVMTVEFQLDGQSFTALNGGPVFTFNEAVSFLVSCETQGEVDRLWAALTADGGQPGRCGWLKDKFGLSWQVVPRTLGALLSGGGDPARAGRVTQAMLQMSKLDLQQLQQAYDEALPSR